MQDLNRKHILKKNLPLNYLYKILATALIYVTVPILIKNLGTEYYGVWLTIFSLSGWVYYLNLGIGNGLKNKLTEALIINDTKTAKELIATAYVSVSFLASIILICGLLIIFFLPLKPLLNTSINEVDLKNVFTITLFSFLISFILNLFKQLYYSLQESSTIELSLFIYQILIVVLLVVAGFYNKESLLIVSLIYGFSSVLVGIYFTYKFFDKHKYLLPKIKDFKKGRIKNIMNLGIQFFMIQMSMIVILSTDNVLISYLLGPKEVASYNIVFKLFQVFLVISSITLIPYWALFTDAYLKNDIKWIQKTFKLLNYLFILLTITVIVFVFNAERIIELWIPEKIVISKSLIYFTALFVLIRIYGDIYNYFLNGIGKIKIQLILMVIGAIINIPLSIYFVEYLKMGNEGVILASAVSLSGLVLVLPVQTFLILKRKKNGL
jgi:O-antigen/teichoic acid export membrane protein